MQSYSTLAHLFEVEHEPQLSPIDLLAFLSCVLDSWHFRIQQFSGFAFCINVGRKQDILVSFPHPAQIRKSPAEVPTVALLFESGSTLCP